MVIRHHRHPIVGWQIHPGSILMRVGLDLLHNFLRTCC